MTRPHHIARCDEYDVSVIVPCYNEAPILEQSLRDLRWVMGQTSYRWELIAIDDASCDETPRLLERLLADRPDTRVILHRSNLGRGGTVTEGLALARGRYAGYLDIDLEVHARYLPSMILAMDKEGYDVATAKRLYHVPIRLDDMFRNVLSLGYRQLVRHYLRLPFEDTETGFKFFRREAILPLLSGIRSQGWFWDTEIMAASYFAKLRVAEIPSLFVRQTIRPSTVRPWRDSLAYCGAIRSFKRRMRAEGRY